LQVQHKRHSDEVKCCVFSPDGTRMVSTGADQTLAIWDTRRWTVRYLVQDLFFFEAASSSDLPFPYE
jgi:WD40 repeat protein